MLVPTKKPDTKKSDAKQRLKMSEMCERHLKELRGRTLRWSGPRFRRQIRERYLLDLNQNFALFLMVV